MPIVPVPKSVVSFRDALGLVLELSDEFAFAQAVLVTDRANRCIDFMVFTEVGDGLATGLRWLSRRIAMYPCRSRVLLISVRSIDELCVAERDLADYRFAEHTIGALGAVLRDWIETDGEVVRSYAYLTNPNTTWSAEALAEGALDATEW